MWYEMKIPTKRNIWKVVWNGLCFVYYVMDKKYLGHYICPEIVPNTVMKRAVPFIKDHKRYGTRRTW